MYNVVVVDDEMIVVDGLTSYFPWADEGFQVVGGAASAEEALTLLDTHHVDVLLTDIAMPSMNGLELITRALAVNPALRSIILSGYSDFNYAVDAIRLGTVGYLVKPVDFDELRDALRKIADSLAREERPRLERSVMLREQFLVALVFGHFKSEQSLRDQMDRAELSIPTNQPGVVIRCWFSASTDDPEPGGLLMGTLDEGLSEHGEAFLFASGAGEVVAVFFPGGEDHVPILRGVAEDIEKSVPTPCFIGVGSPFESLLGASESFVEAEKSLAYRNIEERRGIQFFDVPPPEKPGGLSVRTVQSYILEHLNESLSLVKLADVAFIHPNYLSRLFRERTGETVMDYVTRIRMERACTLLRDPARNITDVSKAVGFTNPRHFSQVFKDNMKCTPTEYRNSVSPAGSTP